MNEDTPTAFSSTGKLLEGDAKPMGGGEWLCNGGDVFGEYREHGELIGQLIVREDGVVVFRRITKP